MQTREALLDVTGSSGPGSDAPQSTTNAEKIEVADKFERPTRSV